MFKKLIIISLLAISASGCATRAGNAALIGGVVGYAIGQSQQPQPVIVQQPRTYTETQIVIDPNQRMAQCQHHRRVMDNCNTIIEPMRRHYCRRDAERRYEQCLYQY